MRNQQPLSSLFTKISMLAAGTSALFVSAVFASNLMSTDSAKYPTVTSAPIDIVKSVVLSNADTSSASIAERAELILKELNAQSIPSAVTLSAVEEIQRTASDQEVRAYLDQVVSGVRKAMLAQANNSSTDVPARSGLILDDRLAALNPENFYPLLGIHRSSGGFSPLSLTSPPVQGGGGVSPN